MGGAVSIEPERSAKVSRIISVITNEEKMEAMFKRIAVFGHDEENMRHLHLGKKNDSLCLPEILLYISKKEDPFFKDLCTNPLSIIKEAFYYALNIDTTKVDENARLKLKLEMTLLYFYEFLEALFMFSRLWEIFYAADDGIADEFISQSEFRRAREKLQEMGGVKFRREMTDSHWDMAFNYMDNIKDGCIEFCEFVRFCVKFIITPEDYMVRAISVCVVKRESIRGFDLSKPLLLQTRRRKRPSRTASFKNRKEIDSKRKELADSMEGKEDKNDIGSIPEHPESSSANNYEDGVHDKQGQKLYESSDSRQIAQSQIYGRSLTAPECNFSSDLGPSSQQYDILEEYKRSSWGRSDLFCKDPSRTKAIDDKTDRTEQMVHHLRNPSKLWPNNITVPLKDYMKLREKRSEAMYGSESADGLTRHSRRRLTDSNVRYFRSPSQLSTATSVRSPMSNRTAAITHTQLASRIEDSSDSDEDTFQENSDSMSFMSISHSSHNFDENSTASEATKSSDLLTTTTPADVSELWESNDDETVKSKNIDIISLVEGLIVAQFDSPVCEKKKKFCES